MQIKLDLSPAVVWQQDKFWGHRSLCLEFAIQPQLIHNQAVFAVWKTNSDGRIIPKWLGQFSCFDLAESHVNKILSGF